MKTSTLIAIVALNVTTSSHAQGFFRSQAPVDFGKNEFKTNCAACHGLEGKGHGPIVDLMKKPPPDLTLLARSNKGILPIEKIYNTIAGDVPQAHGGIGYMAEYPIARLYADARIQRIYGGTTEIMKDLIARRLGA